MYSIYYCWKKTPKKKRQINEFLPVLEFEIGNKKEYKIEAI